MLTLAHPHLAHQATTNDKGNGYIVKLAVQTTKQVPVLGISVDCLPDYPQWLGQQVTQGTSTHVVTLNAEMTMQARQTPQLAAVIAQAELVIPDGAGVVLYLNMMGEQIQRCPGIELAEAMLQQAAEQSWSVLFFGGEPGVADIAAQRWQQRLPGLNIVGTQNGYLNDTAMEQFLQQLDQLQPQLIFVGLGVPRQEYWIAQHRHHCPNSTWMGIGGSFDIWAERKERAPTWLRENNLEWVYRLYQEPWRWRRMLALPKFAWRAFMVKLRQEQ